MADYVLLGDSAFADQLNNFQTKIGGYATTLAVTAAEVTAVQNDYAMFRYLLDTLAILRPGTQGVTTYKDAVRYGPEGETIGAPELPGPFVPAPTTVLAGIEARFRALVQRIKNHPGYTAAIGEDLGITAPAPSTGATPPKPTGSLVALPSSEVRVRFVRGHFDGVYVESQRGAETGWTLLGTDLHSPYLDSREPLTAGQPEVRHYRLRYLQHDAPVGAYSDIMTVTTQP